MDVACAHAQATMQLPLLRAGTDTIAAVPLRGAVPTTVGPIVCAVPLTLRLSLLGLRRCRVTAPSRCRALRCLSIAAMVTQMASIQGDPALISARALGLVVLLALLSVTLPYVCDGIRLLRAFGHMVASAAGMRRCLLLGLLGGFPMVVYIALSMDFPTPGTRRCRSLFPFRDLCAHHVGRARRGGTSAADGSCPVQQVILCRETALFWRDDTVLAVKFRQRHLDIRGFKSI